jgi:hypothetical protein
VTFSDEEERRIAEVEEKLDPPEISYCFHYVAGPIPHKLKFRINEINETTT